MNPSEIKEKNLVQRNYFYIFSLIFQKELDNFEIKYFAAKNTLVLIGHSDRPYKGTVIRSYFFDYYDFFSMF